MPSIMQNHKQFSRCFCFLLVLCAFSYPVNAAQVSGEYLIKVCSLDRNGNELVPGGKNTCQSYIAGVIDYHNMLKAMDLTSDMNFCIPQDESLDRIHIRVLAYMYERGPMFRKFVGASGVAMALFDAYPCNKKKK